MKHRDDIRFATAGSALRRAGRMLAHAQSAARPRSRVAASRMHGQRPSCHRPRGTDRFLLFALP